jgi:uncharacterized protein YbjQ (UPF0145 family)
MTDRHNTTTEGLDGHEITDSHGVVSGEAVIGATVASDIAAGIPDVGCRSGSDETKIETGREEAIADGREAAETRGGDAVVGASFDDEEMPEGMHWVNRSGTAVSTRE